ncbi:MAG: YesL family protein [Oscillospiraceae bacterium]|nr:YesL family protein [Oscillospiraceae bacterium]
MAGFFGLFDYTKPGKGVRKDEPKQSHFVHFFVLVQRKFWKLIQLNLLFVLFCIPIVTIGPAVAGMTYVLRNYANERPVFLFSDFWDAFKSNLKQSLIYELIFAAVAVPLYVAWQFYFLNASEHAWMYAAAALVLILAVIFIFANFYIFLMIVTLDLPLKAIIKNGLIMSAICFKSNIFTLIFVAVTMFALWYVYFLGYLIYLLIGFAFIGFIIVYNSYRGVQKYSIDPYLAAQAETRDESVFSDEQIIREGEEA